VTRLKRKRIKVKRDGTELEKKKNKETARNTKIINKN
jgi:hypothetical protein